MRKVLGDSKKSLYYEHKSDLSHIDGRFEILSVIMVLQSWAPRLLP